MNPIKITPTRGFVLFTLLISMIAETKQVFAQRINKNDFIQIEYLVYDFNSPRTPMKDKLVVENYIKIDNKGKMDIIENERGLKCYLYQLNNDEILELKKIFNGQKQLKKYKIREELEEGVFYAGYYHYLKYTNSKNKTDQISFIDGDLSEDLDSLLSMIYSKSNLFNNKDLTAKELFHVDNTLINEVISKHLKNSSLPKIALPPPGI